MTAIDSILAGRRRYFDFCEALSLLRHLTLLLLLTYTLKATLHTVSLLLTVTVR
jgi:hypothetical protein